MRFLVVLPLSLLFACGDDVRRPDAGTVDMIDAAVAPDAAVRGVPCNGEICAPGVTQGCCVEDGMAPRCEPMNGLCTGQLTSCDGVEDCSTETICCDFGFGPSCTEPANCDPQQGGITVCHGDGECPAATPHCCDARCSATAC